MNMRALIGTDDLPRRAFTVKDIERMSEVGLIREDERVELLGGELIKMNPKGIRHESFKAAIMQHWYNLLVSEFPFITETTFRLSDDTFIEPDFLVYPRSVGVLGLNSKTVLLAVEVSDASRSYDLGPKNLVYAHFGIVELWVIDTVNSRVHVHRDPIDGVYRSITTWEIDDLVVPALAPREYMLRLADLNI